MTAFGLFLAPRLVTAQGTLVVNGGFNFSAGVWTGWAMTNGAGYEAGTGALDNGYFSDSTDPTASQTINGLIPGVTYVVSGQYRGGKDRRAPSPANPSFGVAIEGNLLFGQSFQLSAPGRTSFFFIPPLRPALFLAFHRK